MSKRGTLRKIQFGKYISPETLTQRKSEKSHGRTNLLTGVGARDAHISENDEDTKTRTRMMTGFPCRDA